MIFINIIICVNISFFLNDIIILIDFKYLNVSSYIQQNLIIFVLMLDINEACQLCLITIRSTQDWNSMTIKSLTV
ncbi:hypothetical protein pb186bvf_020428 [Paramecium bursaria]